MIKSLFRVSVSLALVGIVLGIVMGIKQDFTLMPAHAHLNLLGFVTMFLSALYYRSRSRGGREPARPGSGHRQRGRRRWYSRSGSRRCCWADTTGSSRSWSAAR